MRGCCFYICHNVTVTTNLITLPCQVKPSCHARKDSQVDMPASAAGGPRTLAPCGQSHAFPIRRKSGAQLGLPFRRLLSEPRQRVYRSGSKRTERQPGAKGALNAALCKARAVALTWNPHRDIAPRLQLLLLEKRCGYPYDMWARPQGARDGGQHFAHVDGFGWAGGVEDAESTCLCEPNGPPGQIPDINQLHGIGAITRSEHIARARQAHRPVRETIALVTRTGNQSGAHDRRHSRELLARFLFAYRLQWTVELG